MMRRGRQMRRSRRRTRDGEGEEKKRSP